MYLNFVKIELRIALWCGGSELMFKLFASDGDISKTARDPFPKIVSSI